MTQLRTLVADGVYRGIGLDDVGSAVFTLRSTKPTLLNTGVADPTALTPFRSDISTPADVILDPGAHFENVDFGNVRVSCRNTATFINCRQWVTNNRTTTPMIDCKHASVTNVQIINHEVVNFDQGGYQFNAIEGHHFTAYRCKIRGTVDGIRPKGGGGWYILGCYIGDLAWFGNTSTQGPSLNSGNQTHSDCIQTEFGGGQIIGNSLVAYPATWVGTGTPGSGTDAGNSVGWFTQAESVAKFASVFTKTLSGAKTFDGAAHPSGGILTPIMCTATVPPSDGILNLTIEDNWIAGGALQVNALNTNLLSPVLSAERNQHYNDTFYTGAGLSFGYRVRSDLAATIPQTGPDVNTWVDGSGVVARN